MTSQLEITPEAEKDIVTIAENIRIQVGSAAALNVLTQVKKHLKTLAEKPEAGRAGGCDGTREAIMAGLPYIAIYKQEKKSVLIVRVLHGPVERRKDGQQQVF